MRSQPLQRHERHSKPLHLLPKQLTSTAPQAFANNLTMPLRQLANRLVGILHGCLKTRTLYDEATAWSHHTQKAAA